MTASNKKKLVREFYAGASIAVLAFRLQRLGLRG